MKFAVGDRVLVHKLGATGKVVHIITYPLKYLYIVKTDHGKKVAATGVEMTWES